MSFAVRSLLRTSAATWAAKRRRTVARGPLSMEPLESRQLLTLQPAGGEFQVNTSFFFEQQTDETPRQAVASDADGNFVVAWTSINDFFTSNVVFQRFDQTGAKLGGETVAGAGAFTAHSHGAVAMDDDGDFVIVWQGSDGSGNGVFARVFNAAGEPQSDPVSVNQTTSGDQSNPVLAMDADGDFTVAWQSAGQDGSSNGVYARRFNSTGAAVAGEFRVNETTTGGQQRPAIAAKPDGSFIIAWDSAGQDGDSYGVYARRYESSGSAVAGEFRVNNATAGSQSLPSVDFGGDGGFVVGFTSEVDGDSDVYARRFSPTGLPFAAEVRVNQVAAGTQTGVSVGADAGGGFVATYTSVDSSEEGVFIRNFLPDGSADGDEIRVNTFTTGEQSSSSVSVDGQSDLVVVWRSYGQDGDSYGVFAQRYASNQPPIPSPGGPYAITEGESLELDGTGVIDPNGDEVTITWDLDGDGEYDDAIGSTPVFTWAELSALLAATATPADGPSSEITIGQHVTDDGVQFREATTTLVIANAPPATTLTGADSATEGSPYQLTIGPITDPGPDTVQQIVINWGDGTEPTVLNAAGPAQHTYADGGPNATVQISVTLIDEDGEHLAAQKTIQLKNVAPTIALSGAATSQEGAQYQLTLGAVTDPGDDTPQLYIINWGDGQTTETGSAGLVSHTYADDGARQISVTVRDEDGDHVAGTKSFTVSNVAPTIAIAGAAETPEGALYQVTVGPVTDPGDDTVSSISIDWGDGSSPTQLNAPGPTGHVYADGDATYTIKVSVTDEDGTHAAAGMRDVLVRNVAPTVALSGPNETNEGSGFTLTFGQPNDPGDDQITGWVIDWGDGTPLQTLGAVSQANHTFPDDGLFTIRASAEDEDGLHQNVGSWTVRVFNVPPVATITGPTAIDEGSTYTLNLGAPVDPGADTISSWRIDWGDGTPIDVRATGGAVQHVYANDVGGPFQIAVVLVDDDGEHPQAGEPLVAVADVAPTASVSAPNSVNEGLAFAINLGAIVDPGNDGGEFRVDWGDGSPVQVYPGAGVATHAYADGPAEFEWNVEIQQGAQRYLVKQQTVVVANQAPLLVLGGASQVNEGSVYRLSTLAYFDPGDDEATEFRIHWGDGSPVQTVDSLEDVEHVYADGPFNAQISVDVVDEDGVFVGVGSKTLSVIDVAPVADVSGPASVNEGEAYQIAIANLVDPGDDGVYTLSIDWGDGEQTETTWSPGDAVPSHVYVDGPAEFTVAATLIDDGGEHPLGELNVIVEEVLPYVQVAAPAVSLIGAAIELNVIEGRNLVESWTIDWGDGGEPEVFLGPASLVHTYQSGEGNVEIVISASGAGGATYDVPSVSTLLFPSLLPGDANRDMTVDLVDFNILKENFGRSDFAPGEGWGFGDFDFNGAVDLLDFNELKENFGRQQALAGDLDGDGDVDLDDFNAFKARSLAVSGAAIDAALKSLAVDDDV